MALTNRNKSVKNLRIIKTARDEDSINKAAKKGFKPLIKMVEPLAEIRSKYSVVQNKLTGEIKVVCDYRESFGDNENNQFETVIDWTFYYPHNFNSPFAAYLIPKDIKVGERVFIEDLIEDYIGASWNQGDKYRLESCEAIWNGLNLEIQLGSGSNSSVFVG
jgi:hypothetical protein